MYLRLLVLNSLVDIIITVNLKQSMPKPCHLQCPSIIWIPVATSYRWLVRTGETQLPYNTEDWSLAMAFLQGPVLGLGEKPPATVSPAARILSYMPMHIDRILTPQSFS